MPGFDPARFPGVMIHESAYVDEPCEIGEETKIWHFSHVMAGSRIGRRCNLGQNVVVSPDVTLGDNVKVQNNVSLYTGCILEDDVFCGPSVVFTNVITPRSEIVRRGEYHRTLVKTGATLGANATIRCGVVVGRYAFVGAGAVVTRDVPDYRLVVGVPARPVGWACRCGVGLPEPAEAGGADQRVVACPGCGNTYEIGTESIRPVTEVQS
jgi:UDP-2-acetamido-3-amino-2,3-dideoxy-glucuronate N-acetyltransferase